MLCKNTNIIIRVVRYLKYPTTILRPTFFYMIILILKKVMLLNFSLLCYVKI